MTEASKDVKGGGVTGESSHHRRAWAPRAPHAASQARIKSYPARATSTSLPPIPPVAYLFLVRL